MGFNITEIKNERAVISAKDDTITIQGDIEDRDPGEYLNPFFGKAIEQMGDVVKIDLTKLAFINSSGIKSLISFVMGRKEDSSVEFHVDHEKTWQTTSIETVKSLDEEHITII
jgi:hypothetical protein